MRWSRFSTELSQFGFPVWGVHCAVHFSLILSFMWRWFQTRVKTFAQFLSAFSYNCLQMNKIFRPAMTPIHQKKLRTTWYSPTKTFDYQITPEIFWIWTVLFYTINQSMIHSFHLLNQSVDKLFDWFMIFCSANIFVQDLDNIMYNFHWCWSYG